MTRNQMGFVFYLGVPHLHGHEAGPLTIGTSRAIESAGPFATTADCRRAVRRVGFYFVVALLVVV
jgi:hypothetical protein